MYDDLHVPQCHNYVARNHHGNGSQHGEQKSEDAEAENAA